MQSNSSTDGRIPLAGAFFLAEDLKFELAILATVQGFYQKLMRDSLGGDVPIPSGLDEVSLRHSEGDLPETLSRMYRWLHLLDMAITPAMLRHALTPDTDSEVAEALLRYFVRRREASEVNRDKTDLIATFLYRHPRVQGQWQQHGYGLDGCASAFSIRNRPHRNSGRYRRAIASGRARATAKKL